MMLNGKVFTGVHRGSAMIDIYYQRLIHILRFEPFKGTMNVNLDKEIDIENYSSKKINHILIDGSEHIDAFLAPIKLRFNEKEEECWAMWQTTNIYGKNTIEVISKINLKNGMGIKDDDEVEIEFTEKPKKKKRKIPGMSMVAKLYGRDNHLMKS